MATIQKSAKINFYKFVAVKEPSSSAIKTEEGVALATNLNKNTEAINNLGLVVNSLAGLLSSLRTLAVKDLEAEEKNRTKFQANYTTTKKKEKKSSSKLGLQLQTPSFLEGLFNLLGGLFKIAVVTPVLKWISDPANQEKVVNIIDTISKVVKFIFDVAKFGVVNTIEGLYTLLSDESSPWEKIGGLVQGLTGLGTLLLGLRWLSNPTKIITDFGGVLKFLYNNLVRGKRGLLGRAGALGLVAGAAYGGYKLYESINDKEPKEQKSQGGSVKNLPSRAQGGYINGPQSGYKVSLDGGRSTSFIGHGSEYVARKSNGGAFVIPLNTPGTKTQPHLTQKRVGEAKSQGYKLPGRSLGGKVPEMALGGAMGGMMNAAGSWWNSLTGDSGKPKATTSEPVVKKGQEEKPVIGAGLRAVAAGGKWALDKGFTVAEHPNFRKNNYSGSGPNKGTGFNPRGGEAVGGHSNGSLHYKGLALDITDWRPGAWKERTAQLGEDAYQMRDKLKLSQIITDGWGQWFRGGGKSGPGNTGHPSHLHLGFLDGISKGVTGGNGETGQMPANAGGYGAILDLIGKRESDSVGGYNAVNQGGADGGHTALGYSGDYRKAPFNPSGKELTSMTVQEVMDKQYDDGSMSDAQWKSSGKLHAVGRYQFIGSTLKSLVNQGVVSPKDQFSPATQNKLGVALVKQTGGNVSTLKSTWIGLQHESDSAISSALSAGGATTSGGYSAGSGTMSSSNSSGSATEKKPLTAAQKAFANSFNTGPASSAEGKTIGSGKGEVPASRFRGGPNKTDLQKQTEERNNAREAINGRSQQMIQSVMTSVAMQNGVNSQAIQSANAAIQVAMNQTPQQPQLVGGSGTSSSGSIASKLMSTLNPLGRILK